MRVERGASQILFGLLPEQTVDLEGGVWRVSSWVEPVPIPIDQATLRDALAQAVKPWADRGNDGGVSAAIYARSPDSGSSCQRHSRSPRRTISEAMAMSPV